jgi:hypothetical protein
MYRSLGSTSYARCPASSWHAGGKSRRCLGHVNHCLFCLKNATDSWLTPKRSGLVPKSPRVLFLSQHHPDSRGSGGQSLAFPPEDERSLPTIRNAVSLPSNQVCRRCPNSQFARKYVASCDWSAPSALAVTQLPPVLIVDGITRVGAEQPERLSSMPRSLSDGEGARKCRASAAVHRVKPPPHSLGESLPTALYRAASALCVVNPELDAVLNNGNRSEGPLRRTTGTRKQ